MDFESAPPRPVGRSARFSFCGCWSIIQSGGYRL